MAGFMNWRIPLLARRALTMLPSLIILALAVNTTQALVYSQIVLSFGIPFALVPLLLITRDRQTMTDMVSRRLTSTLMLLTTIIAALGIAGNQVVARYKLVVGRRINSATLVADARHSWLDALSSAGALVGLVAVALGFRWGDPIAGIAVTLFICHVGYEVTADVMRRLDDGVDPGVVASAEAAAGSVNGVVHAHARARLTGRTLRVEIEGWVDPALTVSRADALGQQVARAVASELPEIGSFTWTARAAPA